MSFGTLSNYICAFLGVIRVGDILLSRDLPNFEFHKKSPEINVFTIELEALKISARFIQYEKS